MGEFNHYVIVKFKDGVAVEELLQGLENMISATELVKSFDWYVWFFFFKKVMLFPLPKTFGFISLVT